jgi:hypothetical protein
MSTTIASPAKKPSTWLASVGVLISHMIVIGILYVVLTTFVATFAFHYEMEKIVSTPEFDRIMAVSAYVMNYYAVAFLIVFDVAFIMMISRWSPRWLTTYSHIFHSSLVLVLFLSFAWMIHPMAWDDARRANAKVAIDSTSAMLTDGSTISP